MVASNSLRNLSHIDLQKVMKSCADFHLVQPEDSFVHHCYNIIGNLFDHVHITSELFQVGPFLPKEQVAKTIGAEWHPFAVEHIPEHPYFPRMATKLQADISTTDREATYKTFLKTPLLNEFYAEIGGPFQMWIGLRNENDLLINMLYREKTYTDVEIAKLQLIQPHIESAWKNWQHQRTLKSELDILKQRIFLSPEEEKKAAQIRKTINTLTSRQQDVVEMVADGKDNQQIADELNISIGTVKKHLQAIFQIMHVQHRTELAAKWHQGHSIRI